MKKELAKPKQTFWNLTAEKRQKIEAVLVREFATNGYKKASLNTVVKNIGIAKGSLYQYFDNKEMIFLFVFDRFTELIKKMVGEPEAFKGDGLPIWEAVRQVLLAGIHFIDRFPDYFQLYLNVLFEQDIPHRQELISRVRLFSMEYFSPLILQGQKQKMIREDISVKMIVFMIDALLDRFLQGYARSYLDGGLHLSKKNNSELDAEISEMLQILKSGLVIN